MRNPICDEHCIPSEDDCLKAIAEDLGNYYVIVARGDITITHRMKYAAFNTFSRERKDPLSGLRHVTEDWFVRTQLRGLGPKIARFTEPFGKRLTL